MKRSISIVLGLGFGDEGKGLMTDYLCSWPPNPIVVRFSGGHQAGHTVCKPDGKRHVFSQLGSGSFKGAPTFYSKYCTFSPIDFVNEHKKFISVAGITPQFYLDGDAPVTTHYDIFYNRALEKLRQHGSCGVGFAATIERHSSPVKIFARDINYPFIMKEKLKQVRKYYEEKVIEIADLHRLYHKSDFSYGEEKFLDSVYQCTKLVKISTELILQNFRSIIFEGSQGILLDMDYGLFPNVTRSNTTSKNALEIIKRNNLETENPTNISVYYMTRAYQTRHGNGKMTNEDMIKVDNPGETNVHNEFQGEFRVGILDLDLLKYAMECDLTYSHSVVHNLTMTCIDQVREVAVTTNGVKYSIGNWEDDLIKFLPTHIHKLYLSSSPHSDGLKDHEFRLGRIR